MIRRPPRSTLFPYPPLSRSRPCGARLLEQLDQAAVARLEVPPQPRERRLDRPHRLQDVLAIAAHDRGVQRSEEHTSELQSQSNLVCRLLLEKKKNRTAPSAIYYPPLRTPRLVPRSHFPPRTRIRHIISRTTLSLT